MAMQWRRQRWQPSVLLSGLLVGARGVAALSLASVGSVPSSVALGPSAAASLDSGLMQMATERLAMASTEQQQQQPVFVSFPTLPTVPVGEPPSGIMPAGYVRPPPAPADPAPALQAPLAPAPAPMAAPPKPPPAGSLLESIGNKLQTEHQKLAKVSESLLSVNGLVEKTEQSMLGRVLDIETARGLVSKHQEISAANERARGQLRDLGAQVSNFNSLLAAAEQIYEKQASAQRKAEEELEKQLKAHNDALAAQAAQAVKALPGLSLLNKRLRANRAHYEQDLQKLEKLEKSNETSVELEEVLHAIEIEKMEEARLRRSLITVHNFSSSCHLQAEALEEAVEEMSKKIPKQSAAAAASEMQSEATQKANNERLRAEMALLQAEIQRNDHSGQDAMGSLTKDRTALNLLESNIILQVRNISNKTMEAKHRTLLLQKAVQDNIGKSEEEMGRKKGLRKQLHLLQERVSPVVFAALTAENDALNKELDGAVDLVAKAKVEEAKAYAAVQQLTADQGAQQSAVEAAETAVTTAEEEGKEQLKKAQEAAEASKAKSNALLQAAQEALEKVCKPKWDTRQEEKDEEKKTCDQNKQQLMVVQAQMETLKQTLEASQTAEAVED